MGSIKKLCLETGLNLPCSASWSAKSLSSSPGSLSPPPPVTSSTNTLTITVHTSPLPLHFLQSSLKTPKPLSPTSRKCRTSEDDTDSSCSRTCSGVSEDRQSSSRLDTRGFFSAEERSEYKSSLACMILCTWRAECSWGLEDELCRFFPGLCLRLDHGGSRFGRGFTTSSLHAEGNQLAHAEQYNNACALLFDAL